MNALRKAKKKRRRDLERWREDHMLVEACIAAGWPPIRWESWVQEEAAAVELFYRAVHSDGRPIKEAVSQQWSDCSYVDLDRIAKSGARFA